MYSISTYLLIGNLSNIGFQIYYIGRICSRESHPAISTIICHPYKTCPIPILVTTGNSLLFSFLYEYTLGIHGHLYWFVFLYANICAMLLFTKHGTYTHNIIAGNIFLNMLVLMYYWSIQYSSYFYVFPISNTFILFSVCHKVIRDCNKVEVPLIMKEEAIFIVLFLICYSNVHILRVHSEKITYL